MMNVSKSFEKSLFPVLPLKNFHKETIEMKAFYDEVIKEGHDTKNNSQTKNLFEKEIFPRRKLLQFENKESTLISLLEDGYENTVLEYAKFSFLIAKYTSRFFKSNPKLKCPYSWANSFDPKKFIQIDRPEYEHASILYNLAIISYCKAINSALNSNVSIKKKSIDRIRNSLWFLSQIKTMPQSIQSVFQKDLSTKFIAVLEDMFSGVYFGIMCEILKMDCEDLLTSTPSEESLNKYSFNNKLASDFFGRAYTALKEEADFMDNALKNDLDFLQEYYNSRALLYYGKLIKKKNQEAKGYIESSMKIIVKLEKTIKVENKTLIEKDKNTNVSYLKTLIENENEVVKEKIESKNQKNDSNKEFIIKIPVSLDDDIARIEPLEPQNFQEKVDEIENLFSFLIPREKMRIKKEYEDNLFSYELIINQEMNKIEAKIEKMRNDLTIETIIKLKDQKDEDIYIKEFKEKADALKKIYGGLAFYINQRHFLLNMRLNLKRRFEILRERKKGVLDDISLGKLKIDPNKHYKYLEDDILRKFEDSESHKINIDLIEKLTSKDLVIQNFMKTADLNLFNQNKEKIEDLIKLNSDIKTNLETLKTESKDFPKVLNQTKKTFLKVLNANKFGQFLELLSEPAKEFVDKIKKKIESIEEIIGQVYTIGGEIKEKMEKEKFKACQDGQMFKNVFKYIENLFSNIIKIKNNFFLLADDLDHDINQLCKPLDNQVGGVFDEEQKINNELTSSNELKPISNNPNLEEDQNISDQKEDNLQEADSNIDILTVQEQNFEEHKENVDLENNLAKIDEDLRKSLVEKIQSQSVILSSMHPKKRTPNYEFNFKSIAETTSEEIVSSDGAFFEIDTIKMSSSVLINEHRYDLYQEIIEEPEKIEEHKLLISSYLSKSKKHESLNNNS